MKTWIKYFVIGMTFFFILVMSNWIVWYTFSGGTRISKIISNPLIKLASIPSITHGFFVNNFSFEDQRLIADSSKSNGFQFFGDSTKLPEGKILVSTFDQNMDQEIKLINIKDGLLLKKWFISTNSILKIDKHNVLKKNNIRLTHPLMLKDSSIILHTWDKLICIDKLNKIRWVNHQPFHHSIELLNDSTIWTCSRKENNQSFTNNKNDTIFNDAIAMVNVSNGKTTFIKSVFDILKENGYAWLFAIGKFENDIIHLNEVYPAINSTKYWNQGDLLISIRNRSTVFIYRPSNNKVIWLKTGPWSNQHSCSFIDSSRIMIFGNDVIRSGSDNFTLLNRNNHIYIYNFSNNSITKPYDRVMEAIKIKTLFEGRVTNIKEGKIFIEETNAGKIYIVDTINTFLKYSERVDKNHIKMFNWNRYIPN